MRGNICFLPTSYSAQPRLHAAHKPLTAASSLHQVQSRVSRPMMQHFRKPWPLLPHRQHGRPLEDRVCVLSSLIASYPLKSHRDNVQASAIAYGAEAASSHGSFGRALDQSNQWSNRRLEMQQVWAPVDANRSCLVVVDVQPEYWSKCQQVKEDFPHFPTKCGETITLCRKRGVPIIFIRADYRISHSPWLRQFRRVSQRMTGAAKVEPAYNSGDDCAWEDFAAPDKDELVIGKPSWNATSGRY